MRVLLATHAERSRFFSLIPLARALRTAGRPLGHPAARLLPASGVGRGQWFMGDRVDRFDASLAVEAGQERSTGLGPGAGLGV
ncbi:hypothetical protein [Streptomyces sp. DSM 40750]|uniref:hypothetical protein n=1 Tax=Streptomyces sp. DSM 40750 TaxID=2801030 RepID=UPI00214C3A92|nr:hypothetical protein [Streptomyces sp. DSM 40750]UUU26840.1 hypothetical protein JIX55_45165 [Streptomyces sp. DSM 40750]